MLDLPIWFYRACYIVGSFTLLTAEILAIFDPSQGDTITEHVRPVIRGSSLWQFLLVAVLLWIGYHFLWEAR